MSKVKCQASTVKPGYSLVELLLYVGILGSMILSITGFWSMLMKERVKNQAISEVEQQGIQVMQIITQTGRNSEVITYPAFGTSDSSLTLDVITALNDPTIIDLVGGVIRIKEGAGTAVSLTNSRVIASNLIFQNLSRTSTQGTFRVQFTLSNVNPSGRNEYDFSKTFYGSASLR